MARQRYILSPVSVDQHTRSRHHCGFVAVGKDLPATFFFDSSHPARSEVSWADVSCGPSDPVKRCERAWPMQATLPTRREHVATLYRRYGALVSGRCRYLLGDADAAQDATQEVFVKVMRNLDQFRGESSASTWILRIATNHCLNRIASERAGWKARFRRHVQHVDEAGLRSGGVDPERARLVRQILARFDRETQAVAIHYYVDEMTQEEIGALLGRSLPTIRKRLAKFRRVARKEVGDDAFG